MAIAGRILILTKGEYDPSADYEMLDVVTHNNNSWIAKRNARGIEPSEANDYHWGKLTDIKIANTLDTEVEGRALDARQGKVLSDMIGSIEGNVTNIGAIAEAADNKADNALNISRGKNQARVFLTTEAMETWLSDATNVGVAQVGDNLYIVDVGVPDWWVSEVLDAPDETGRYYKIARLETQKVDLTTLETEVSQLQSDVVGLINSKITMNVVDDTLYITY